MAHRNNDPGVYRGFAVLVPYKAACAATMIAIGADKIVMGRKGELGPLDPQLQVRRRGDGGMIVQEQNGIEDIISYFRFARDKAGLSDQSVLTAPFSALTAKPRSALDTWRDQSSTCAYSLGSPKAIDRWQELPG